MKNSEEQPLFRAESKWNRQQSQAVRDVYEKFINWVNDFIVGTASEDAADALFLQFFSASN